MCLIFFAVSFLASLVGSICGIGGGVLIKPILDATAVMSVSEVSFLSGCTVLSMSMVSVLGSVREGKHLVRFRKILPLAVGAALGGLVGKLVFQQIKSGAASENLVGMIQELILLALTFLTLVYTLKKQDIKTLHLQSRMGSACIGLFLGFLSSFLGIGGGPVNLMILGFFFSMRTKEAAANSLFVILLSQTASLLFSVGSGNVPDVDAMYLILMVAGGILGGKIGGTVCKRLSCPQINRLFEVLMVVIMGISLYNIWQLR